MIKKLFLILLLLCFSGLNSSALSPAFLEMISSGEVSCGEISETTYDNAGSELYQANFSFSQTFVADVSGGSVTATYNVSSITGNPGANSYIKIHTDCDFSGAVSCTSSGFDVVSTGEIDIELTGCNLTATTEYCMGIRHDGGDVSNSYAILKDNDNPYADGIAYRGFNSWDLTTVWDANAKDMYFKVVICP